MILKVKQNQFTLLYIVNKYKLLHIKIAFAIWAKLDKFYEL